MSSIFSQQSSLFNQPAQQPNTGGGLFGSVNTNQNQPKPKLDLFGSLNTNIGTSQPQQNGSLYGATTSQPAQSGGLFGSTQTQTGGGGLFGNASQPQQSGGLFGSTPQPQQAGGLFGSTQEQKPGGLFGSTTQPQQGSNIFGQPQNQQQNTQQGGGLFGSLGTTNQQAQQQQQQQPQQAGGSLFGNFGQATQQPQQSQQQGSVLGQSLGQSRLFQDSQIAPRQKSVTDQIELAFAKWNPQSPHTLFQTYLYNSVPASDAPFYGPGTGEDETKWEDALSKKPSPGSIPVAVRGFEQLALRMQTQYQNLAILRGRLHEINEGLNTLLQRHDLDVSIRAAECRRKHLVLSKQCLSLAAKTQVLRNRGYAMDAAEEELRKKLLGLEKSVCDPAIAGRGEEIWARMVSVRERGRMLRREYERAGRDLDSGSGAEIDEEVMKRARKILEDYSSQLAHLKKELEELDKDWKEYEQSRSLPITSPRY